MPLLPNKLKMAHLQHRQRLLAQHHTDETFEKLSGHRSQPFAIESEEGASQFPDTSS